MEHKIESGALLPDLDRAPRTEPHAMRSSLMSKGQNTAKIEEKISICEQTQANSK